MESIEKKLMEIQQKLQAPKNQKNTFGGYNYRSCEDILQAVKPLLAETKTTLRLSDDMVQVGDRIYVKATATLTSVEDGKQITNTAFAREEESKKGMDDSQITGASSSYARKYALNGLFGIDDNKDSDATNTHDKGEAKSYKAQDKPASYKLDFKVVEKTLESMTIESQIDSYAIQLKNDYPDMTAPQSRFIKQMFDKRRGELQ